MQEGMTFTIEPALSLGSSQCRILSDGWTAVTTDGSRAAQFEHTVLITKYGVEVLTIWEGEKKLYQYNFFIGNSELFLFYRRIYHRLPAAT